MFWHGPHAGPSSVRTDPRLPIHARVGRARGLFHTAQGIWRTKAIPPLFRIPRVQADAHKVRSFASPDLQIPRVQARASETVAYAIDSPPCQGLRPFNAAPRAGSASRGVADGRAGVRS